MFARTRQDILQLIRLKAQLGASPTCRCEYAHNLDRMLPYISRV